MPAHVIADLTPSAVGGTNGAAVGALAMIETDHIARWLKHPFEVDEE